MRKDYIFICAVVICLLMLGIVSMLNIPAKNPKTDDGKLTIVTSFYPMYLLAKNVTAGAENVEVINLTKPNTGCLHDYQLTAEDMITLGKADIFVINGLGMESFLDKAISTYPDLYVLDTSKNADKITDNAHIWLSINNYEKQAENLSKGLIEKDPENADIYTQNSVKYIERLDNLKDYAKEILKKIENKNVVLFHDGFEYFAKDVGLNVLDVIENGEGSAPSAGELADIIQKIKQYTINEAEPLLILVEPQYDFASATAIARETGARIEEIDTVVTGDENELDTYIRAMKNNVNILSR